MDGIDELRMRRSMHLQSACCKPVLPSLNGKFKVVFQLQRVQIALDWK
jgi:hypothetical protein